MKAYFYRIRFVASVIAVTLLPILVTGIVLLQAAEQALLEEKKQKLIAITQQLDRALSKDFDEILRESGMQDAARPEKIQALNRALMPITDEIARLHPGVGVGYYAADLDAIVTYGPSSEMHQHVGKSIPDKHPGRRVLQSGTVDVAVGEQVRGNIMNAMTPLYRNGKVIGYAWGNELMSSIDVQLAGMRQSIFAILGIGGMAAAAVSGLLMHRLEVILAEIKAGLHKLSLNLSFRMRRLAGEPGEITDAINKLAADLQASRTHTENIIHSMDSGVIALDHNGVVQAWNQAASDITGIAVDHAIGRSYEELFTGEETLVSALQDTLQSGRTNRDVEWRYCHPQGERSVKASTSILRSPAGDVLGAIVVLEDRTEWKTMEAQLAQAKRLAVIGELAASIAHEVRNPLTSIKAFAQIIEEDLPAEHDSREYTAIIVEEVERLNQFTDELLLFSRPKEERNVPVVIHDVLEQTLLLLKRKAAKQKVELTRQYFPGLPPVEASPELLKQVFLNILLNALQAMPQGGGLQLQTEGDEHCVWVHVTNDGQPIAEAHLNSIFEPFFTTKPSGTGLGLSISQRIVQAYGGNISVQNVPNGVRFTVELPVKKEGV
ncbi:two-component system sensor histidine kinase AtoS [Brevibacillus sp. H7]|uniref:two-component system sensor histidine kinase AtoS n=1 Tax=Brevibacillus sp. H7 TaxID=3349138 RepID=UPI00382AE7DF